MARSKMGGGSGRHLAALQGEQARASAAYQGAIYHVINRVNYRADVFDKGQRQGHVPFLFPQEYEI